MLQVQRPTFCEGAPSLRSGPGSTFWLSVHAGPSLRSGPGSTFWPPVHALSPGTIFCECPVRARTLTSVGLAVITQEDRQCFKLAAGTLTAFRVRAGYSGRAFDASSSRPILCEGALWGRCECPVRARSFERGPSLRSGPGLTFL